MSVYLGIPAYGGIEPEFLNSILAGVLLCREVGISVEYEIVTNCSLIAKARNEIVNHFLKTDCSQLVFLDADMSFKPEELVRLIQRPEPVVGGAYVRKDGSGQHTVTPLSPHVERDGVWEVEVIATGFLKIRREVFETMQVPTYGEFKAFFNCGIREDGNYWGEDYGFCSDYRKQGGRIWMLPCELGHVGRFTYRAIKEG